MSGDRRGKLEATLIEHLESAQAITDELGLDQTGYLVERALDNARAVHWPNLDPNVEAFRKPPKCRDPQRPNRFVRSEALELRVSGHP